MGFWRGIVMNTNDASANRRDRLEAVAAWHVRLNGDEAGEQDWLAFTQWLEGDAANRLAYDEVERLSQDIDGQSGALHERVVQTPVPVLRPAWRTPARPRRHWAAAVTAIAAGIAVAVFAMRPGTPPSEPLPFATGIGERRDLALADGSQIRLNTATMVAVDMSGGARRVRLQAGEAFFDVAPDRTRPFIVDVGDQRVEVVGTAFNIIRHQGLIAVTVARGLVNVKTGGGAAAPAERLTAGDQLTHREGENAVSRTSVEIDSALAWRDGRLVFSDAPIAQVVADLNRYFPLAIRLEGSGVDELRFSGVLKLDDETAVLGRLQEFLPVEAQVQPDGVILRRKTASR